MQQAMLNTWFEPGIYKPRGEDCGCTMYVVEFAPHGMRLAQIRNRETCSKGSHTETDFEQVWSQLHGVTAEGRLR